MYLPLVYEDLLSDYWNLKNEVSLWDVGCERQVEITGPDAFIRTNIHGTFTLLEAARSSWLDPAGGEKREGCRYLHVSTDEVFGSLGATGYFSETTCYDPRSPYSASKASSAPR